jgi:hypothetical protein
LATGKFGNIDNATTKIDEYKATMKPLPYEDEYLAQIPIKFFDHQIDAVRW